MARRKLSAERPGRGAEFAYDEARHRAAYLYARDLAAGGEVLDAGCGEGFGTVILAERARRVLGIDYASEAVATASAHYRDVPNLSFTRLDVQDLPGLGRRFDLITNFQVIEHLHDPRPFLTAVRAGLADDGVLMLTTPNRLTSVSENPVHVREYTADELAALLEGVFGRVTMHSMVGNEKVLAFDRERGRQVQRILRLDPLGLRHRLPQPLVHFAFAQLGALVRRRAGRSVAQPDPIRAEDFRVVAERRDDALDLVALCRP